MRHVSPKVKRFIPTGRQKIRDELAEIDRRLGQTDGA
jgi:hypothetical protein